eukprot:1984239-Prymnesium_polylepis.1
MERLSSRQSRPNAESSSPSPSPRRTETRAAPALAPSPSSAHSHAASGTSRKPWYHSKPHGQPGPPQKLNSFFAPSVVSRNALPPQSRQSAERGPHSRLGSKGPARRQLKRNVLPDLALPSRSRLGSRRSLALEASILWSDSVGIPTDTFCRSLGILEDHGPEWPRGTRSVSFALPTFRHTQQGA